MMQLAIADTVPSRIHKRWPTSVAVDRDLMPRQVIEVTLHWHTRTIDESVVRPECLVALST